MSKKHLQSLAQSLTLIVRLITFVAITVCISFSLACAVAIPQLQNQEKHSRETAAILSLQDIHRAQAQFYAAKGKYAKSLNELAEVELLNQKYGEGKAITGYVYTITDASANTFTAHADRVSDRDGFNDFNITEKGDVYKIENKTKGTVPRGQGKLVGENEGVQ